MSSVLHNAAHEREVAACLALAEQALEAAFGPERAAWMQHLEREHHRLVDALEWLVQRQDAQRGLHLAYLLQELWFEDHHTTEGRVWLERLLALPGAAEGLPLRARVLDLAGALALNQGDYATAAVRQADGLAILRQLGEPLAIGFALMHMGNLTGLAQGNFAQARELYREAWELLAANHHPEGTAHALANQGTMAILMGDYAPARQLTLEGLRRYLALDLTYDIALSLWRAAGVVAGLGQAETALSLAGAGAAHLAAIGVSQPEIFRQRYNHMLEPARQALTAEAQAAAWAAGQSMSLDKVVALALTCLETGHATPAAS